MLCLRLAEGAAGRRSLPTSIDLLLCGHKWRNPFLRNTPAEIVEKLNKEIDAGLADPKVKSQLANLIATSLTGSAADFGKLIADETEKWAKVIRAPNIKAE